MVHHRKKQDHPGHRPPQAEPGTSPEHTNRDSPTPPRGHRTPGEADQKHRATGQASQAPAGNLAERKDTSANRINLFMIQQKLIMFALWECSDIPLKISTAG